MSEPFLTYRFQGLRFEFIVDKVIITDERRLPFYSKYELSITDFDPPLQISVLEEGHIYQKK